MKVGYCFFGAALDRTQGGMCVLDGEAFVGNVEGICVRKTVIWMCGNRTVDVGEYGRIGRLQRVDDCVGVRGDGGMCEGCSHQVIFGGVGCLRQN